MTTDGKTVAPVVWEARLPRRGLRLVHDGHQRQGAPGVLRARRSDRAQRRDDHPRADDASSRSCAISIVDRRACSRT